MLLSAFVVNILSDHTKHKKNANMSKPRTPSKNKTRTRRGLNTFEQCLNPETIFSVLFVGFLQPVYDFRLPIWKHHTLCLPVLTG